MSPTTNLFVDREAGTMVLRSPTLGQAQPWAATREIVGRLLATDCVDSVVVNRARETATIQLKQGVAFNPFQSSTAAQALRAIAGGLRHTTSSHQTVSDAYSSCRVLRLHNPAEGITAGTIVHALPGRVRLRHPLVRQSPDLAHRIESSLALIPGVQTVSASAATGSVVVVFKHTTNGPSQLLAALEQIVSLPYDKVHLLAGPPVSRWISSGTCLGLAVASEFLVPGLAPVTAIALVGCNLPTLSRGLTELCTGHWRVSSLYTVIMGTTLISGQFLAAAIMQASITGWHGWSSRRLRQVVDQLSRNSHQPLTLPDRQQHHVLTEEIQPHSWVGTVVTIEPGTLLPCDGIVVDGEGELDERCVRGVEGISRRRTGAVVFAGCRLLQGRLKVRITAVEKETRLSKVRHTLVSSIAELPGTGGPTSRSQSRASRFVPWTFATGTAALLVGDLTTLAAVLRPDFSTGPSMSERFGTLSSVSQLLDRGWLVKNTATLDELENIEVVVITRVEEPATAKHVVRVPSDGDHNPKVAARPIRNRTVSLHSRSLDIYDIDGDEAACLVYVRKLRAFNRRVAVVGCGRLLSQLSDDDVVRISSTPEHCLGEQTADIVALHAEAQPVEDLWQICHASRRPAQQAWTAVVTCNALAISGAFIVGLTSLHVVVLTNLGMLAAGALYERHFRRAGRLLSSRVQHEKPFPWTDVTADVDLQNDAPAMLREGLAVNPEADDNTLYTPSPLRKYGRHSLSGRSRHATQDQVSTLSLARTTGTT